MQNLESENSWKTKECSYLLDKIKNLENALEKLKIKDRYSIRSNNNNEANYADFLNHNRPVNIFDDSQLSRENRTKENLIDSKYQNNNFKNNASLNNCFDSTGNSKITFEDGSGREECNINKCECNIY